MKKFHLTLLSSLFTLCAISQTTLETVTSTTNGNYTTQNIWIGMSPNVTVTPNALNLGGTLKLLGAAEAYTAGADGTQPTIYRSASNSLSYPFNVFDNLILQAGTNNKDILFVTGSSPSAKMTIKGDGSVGIGTSTPGIYKLAVEGTIGARKVKVTQAAWADFVFQDHYKLPSIAELEKYIERNKHLPDVPSEKEVLKNGIDLGEMNAKLLQKIEELTLYIIQMNKRNDIMEQRIKELEKK